MSSNVSFDTGEMIPGTDQGSYYRVIAKNGGYKLAVKGYVFPQKGEDEQAWVFLGFRLRVVPISDLDNVDVEEVEKAFGILGFSEKGKHASVMAGLPICSLPCWPPDILKQAQNGKARRAVEMLYHKLDKVGAKTLMDRKNLVEYLLMQYEEILPEIPVKTPTEEELKMF